MHILQINTFTLLGVENLFCFEIEEKENHNFDCESSNGKVQLEREKTDKAETNNKLNQILP